MNNSKTWVSLQLGEVCKLRGGVAFKPALQGRNQGEFPFIKVSDFNLSGNEVSINGANNWVDAADSSIIQGQTFPAGATVFAKIGEALKHNRKRFLTRPTYIDNNLMAAVAKLDVMLPEFLFQLFRTIDIAASDVGTAVPYVKASTLEKIAVVIPPIEIQRRIASILGAYDDLIEVNRRRIAVLEEMAQGMFEEWFVRFRFPGHEAAAIEDTPDGSLPAGWSWGQFADLASEIRDTVLPESVDPATPYIGLEHISRRSTTLAEYGTAADVSSLKARFRRGDILFGKIRPYFHKVAWAPFGGVASTDAIIWRPTAALAAQALLQASNDAFVAYSVQTSNGTKMPRANTKVLADYRCALAPSNISERFENAVGPMIESAASLQAANLILATARDLLLPRLISGQLSVTQAERELWAA